MNWTLWLAVASDRGTETLVRLDVEGDREMIERRVEQIRHAVLQHAPELRGLSNPTIKSELLQPGEWRDPPEVQEKLAAMPWSVCVEVFGDGGERKELRLSFGSKPESALLEKAPWVAEQVAVDYGMVNPRAGKLSIERSDAERQ